MCLSGIYFICCGTRDDPIDGWAITPGLSGAPFGVQPMGWNGRQKRRFNEAGPCRVQRTAIGAVIPA
jgi:hypothetical protein